MGRFIKILVSGILTMLVMTMFYYFAYAIFMTIFPNANTFVVNIGMAFTAIFIMFMSISNRLDKLEEIAKYHEIQKDIKEYQKEHQERIKELIDVLNK